MYARENKQKTKRAKMPRVLLSLLLVGVLMMAFSITSQALEGDGTSGSLPTTEAQQSSTSVTESVSEPQSEVSVSQTESEPESLSEDDSSISEVDSSEVEAEVAIAAFSAGQATVNDGAEFEAAFNDTSVTTILLAANIELPTTMTLPAGKSLVVASVPGSQFVLTVAGGNARHFAQDAGSSLMLDSVVLDGQGTLGGIDVAGSSAAVSNLVVSNTVIRNCVAPSSVMGGAINALGSDKQGANVVITGSSVLEGNKAYYGGAATVRGGTLTIDGDTVIRNNNLSGYGAGAGIYVNESALNISGNVLFQGNDPAIPGRQQPGGAIFLQGSAPCTIGGNVQFIGNKAGWGGAVCAGWNGSILYYGVITISGNILFHNNVTSNHGGAIYMHNGGAASKPVLNVGTDGVSNIRFIGNKSTYDDGGAIYMWQTGTANIGAGTLFDGNQTVSGRSGGALYSYGSTVNINGSASRRVVFQNGYANSCGGALCIIGGTKANIYNADFLNNYAMNFGGAIDIDQNNTVLLDGCVFRNNTCRSSGGAIAGEATNNITLKNTVVDGNSAGGYPHATGYRNAPGTGGGIYFEKGSLTLEGCTVTNNSTPKAGGGIGMGNTTLDAFLKSIKVSNTTFSGNVANVLYNLTDTTYVDLHAANINKDEGSIIYSQGLDFAYNNFDITYKNDPPSIDIQKLTVTFDARGGAPEPAPLEVAYDTSIDKPADPVKDGDVFLGWVTSSGELWGFNNPAGTQNGAPVRADMTLYAKWQSDVTYTVTFDSMGGSAVDAVSGLVGGSLVAQPADPVYSGFVFEGWYKESACTNEWDFDTDTVSGNMTLYAKWRTAPTYTVTYDGNGADVEAAPTSVSVGYPGYTVASLPQQPQKANHTFNGWNTMPDGSGEVFNTSYVVKKNMTVYAQWLPVTYQLSFDTNGGYGTPATQSLAQGALAATPSVTPTRSGYQFMGWNRAQNGTGAAWNFATTTMPGNNVVLYAQWKQVSTPPPASSSSTPAVSSVPSSSSGSGASSSSTTPDSSSGTTAPTASSAPSSSSQQTVTPGPGGEGSGGQGGGLLSSIINGEVPLGGLNAHGAWSLVSLIMSVVGVFISLFVFLRTLMAKRKNQEDDYENAEALEEDESRSKRGSTILKVISMLAGVGTCIVFLILDNLANPMVWINRNTLIVGIVFLVHIVALIIARITRSRPKQEEEDDDFDSASAHYARVD